MPVIPGFGKRRQGIGNSEPVLANELDASWNTPTSLTSKQTPKTKRES